MTIRKLRIGHFGKLHNVTLEFGSGLNLVTGANESGKSTVHAFIGAMLFGLEKNKGRAGKDNMYMRYLPWDTPGAYQGSMDFEHNGREYRLTRVFYLKERSCTLTETATGREIPLEDDSITSLIPELTVSAFRNTVSMGQKALRQHSDFAGEVSNYLANLSTSGGREVDVRAAREALLKKKKQLAARYEASDPTEAREELDRLLLAEEESEKLTAGITELETQACALESELEEVRARQTNLTEAAGTDELRRSAEAAFEKVRQLSDVKEAQQNPDTECDGKPVRGRNAGIILTLVGVLLCLLGNNSSKPAVISGVVLMIAGLVLFLLSIISIKERGLQKAEGEAAAAALIRENESRLRAADEEYRACAEALRAAEMRREENSEERERLHEREKELIGELGKVNSGIEIAEYQLESIGDTGASIGDCTRRIRELEELRETAGTERRAVELALDTLNSLSEELHGSFAADFNDLISEEAALATDGRYCDARVNAEFGLEVMSGLDYVPVESLSTGACEQLYLALRFAVARLFFDKVPVPFLLDESFAYSDEERLTGALSALRDRDDRQIILFTCRRIEQELLDKLGAEYNLIRLE